MIVKSEHKMVSLNTKCHTLKVGKGLDPRKASTVALVETLAESTELLHDSFLVHQLNLLHLLVTAGEKLSPGKWVTADRGRVGVVGGGRGRNLLHTLPLALLELEQLPQWLGVQRFLEDKVQHWSFGRHSG